MSSVPKPVVVRANLILQASGSEEQEKFVSAGFDEAVFLFKHNAKHVDAILSVKLAFAKTRDLAKGAASGWYKQMYAPDAAIAALEEKEYTFASGAVEVTEFALSIPLMDAAVRITVSETSTTKGDLQIDAVGTSIGIS